MRRTVGETKYRELSQRYPNYTNATRQRLIAADPEMPVPEEFAEILQWLVPDPQRKKTLQNRPDGRLRKPRDRSPDVAVSRLGSIKNWNGAMATQTYALTRIGQASKVTVITLLGAIWNAATEAAIGAFRALIRAA